METFTQAAVIEEELDFYARVWEIPPKVRPSSPSLLEDGTLNHIVHTRFNSMAFNGILSYWVMHTCTYIELQTKQTTHKQRKNGYWIIKLVISWRSVIVSLWPHQFNLWYLIWNMGMFFYTSHMFLPFIYIQIFLYVFFFVIIYKCDQLQRLQMKISLYGKIWHICTSNSNADVE